MKPTIKLFNTLTRKKKLFHPIKQGKVGIYTCGPTVYDLAHIGNLRSFVFADALVRFLRFSGFDARWVVNITDIDDKTIAGAKKAGESLKEFTQKYEKRFFGDLSALNIAAADHYPRATQHFEQMRELVKKLEAKGLAYRAQDGIYFDISKFPNYGQLSGLRQRQLKSGARVNVDTYDKKSPGDFALWKKDNWKLKTENWELAGRPGWHLECSAMSRRYLGQPFDIHTGGVDLVFPHHENEIAQSSGAYGKPLANFFIHHEHLLVNGKKMAKSAGTFITLRDVVDKGFEPLALRYLFLQTHYREKMNFTWEALGAAQKAMEGVRAAIQRNISGRTSEVQGKILAAIEDDLNIPKALGLLHEAGDSGLWLEFDKVLGLGLSRKKVKLTKSQREMVNKREQLRSQGKFSQADMVREQLGKQGIIIEDTPGGPELLTK